VTVEVHRDRDADVTQKGLSKLRVDALGEQQRGAGVSKAVEPDALGRPERP
jgi:hypothetical protein